MTGARDAPPLFLNVVIPTRNRAQWLARCLRSLADQTYPATHFDVTVCDDASDIDMTSVPGAGDALNVRTLRLARARGPAAARNAGWRLTSGDAVVFLDDDVVVGPAHLALVAARLHELGATGAGVEGRVEPLWEGQVDRDSPFLQTLQTSGGGHSCNIAYWRSTLERTGGFDEGFLSAVGEDYDLAFRVIRQVGPIFYDAGLLVHHAVHGERTIRGLLALHGRHRPSWLRLYVKHPEQFPPRFLPAWLHAVFRQIVSRPTPARFVTFLLVREVLTLYTFRRLAQRRPWLYLRWCLLVLANTMAIATSWPSLRKHWHRMCAEGINMHAAA